MVVARRFSDGIRVADQPLGAEIVRFHGYVGNNSPRVAYANGVRVRRKSDQQLANIWTNAFGNARRNPRGNFGKSMLNLNLHASWPGLSSKQSLDFDKTDAPMATLR